MTSPASPRVSVIMAVRNGAAHLQEAIDSILCQTLVDFEFLIVDDASDDETPDILNACAAKDARIRVIRNEVNIGPYPSANKALALARAPLIARMDGDDISAPERLDRQVAFLEAHPEHLLVGCGYLSIDGAGRTRYARPNPLDDSGARWIAQIAMPMVHPGFCFRSSDPDGTPVRYREQGSVARDYALVADLLRRGKVAALGDMLVQYRMHARNISSTRRGEQDRVALALAQEVMRAESGGNLARAFLPFHETLYRARARSVPGLRASRRALRAFIRTSSQPGRTGWMKRRASVYLAEAFIGRGGPLERLRWAVLVAVFAPDFVLPLLMRLAETKGWIRSAGVPGQDRPRHRPQAQPRA